MSKNINKIQISSSEDDKLQLGGNWLAKKLWRLEYWIREKVYSIRRDIDSHYSELNDVIGHIGPNGKNIITLQNNVSTLQGNWAQYTLCDTIIWFTGEEIHYQAYRSSEFIAINRQYPIIVRANFAIGDPSKAWLALYAADFSFIGAIYHNGNAIDATIANGVCTLEAEKIPSNAVYFRTCVQESEISNSYYTNGPTQEAREGAVNNATSAVVKALDNKVDKIERKSLSSNDYTDADKVKLSELPTNEGLSSALATKADRTELSNIVGTPSDGVIEDLEPTLIERAKYALFDAQWTAAGGTVITPGKVYECNGTDDLTFDEAVNIMARYSKRNSTDLTNAFFAVQCRALLPIWVSGNLKMNAAFQSSYIRKIVFKTHQTPSVVRIANGGSGAAFHTCWSLREIDGILDFTAEHEPLVFTFRYCDELREVRIKGLNSKAYLDQSRHISLASLQYLVENATNTKAITLTVHPDVFAKLTDESNTEWNQVLTDATNKNITFATV